MRPVNHALRFIVLLGVVSLFADITYEGARSISGQYLALLGASGLVVGVVSGFGEWIGYSFRLVSGYFSDRSQKYWLFTFIGYALTLFAVPLLALAGNWPLAASLLVLERLGKAVRNPPRDAMLSYAAKEVGRGWGFGLHEALDQAGAILGPLFISAVLYFKGSYQLSFALLLLPGLAAFSLLLYAHRQFPSPQNLEMEHQRLKPEGLTKKYWLYVLAVSCIGAGFIDFPLIAFHFKQTDVMADALVPIIFSVAMASDGLSALFWGRLYDRIGLKALISATLLSALFPLFVFVNNPTIAVLGMILWGIGLGAQESVMRAVVANLTPVHERGTAYGIFNFGFGLSWFLGSALMGYLYDVSFPVLILFSSAMQLAAIPLFVYIQRQDK